MLLEIRINLDSFGACFKIKKKSRDCIFYKKKSKNHRICESSRYRIKFHSPRSGKKEWTYCAAERMCYAGGITRKGLMWWVQLLGPVISILAQRSGFNDHERSINNVDIEQHLQEGHLLLVFVARRTDLPSDIYWLGLIKLLSILDDVNRSNLCCVLNWRSSIAKLKCI
jgi:hypothetical protein